MTLQKQITFWVVSFLALILVLWLLSPILLPFIAGLVLAYFLDPVADALERLGLPRLMATTVILLLSILLLVLIGLLVVPILGDQIVKFAGDLPSLMQSLLARFNDVAPQWMKDAITKSGADIQGSVSDIAGKAAGWTATLLASVWSGGMALVNILSLLVVTPIVAFYLLADWDRLVAKVDSWLPRDHAEAIRAIFNDIDAAMAGFIRGQGTVCLLLGLFYALALTVAGLKFGLVIGLGAGLLSFIPYVGALVGGVVAIGVGLVQFWPDFASIADRHRHLRRGPVHRRQFPLAQAGGQQHWPASRLADVCAVCLWLRVWLCRAVAGRSLGGRGRRSRALCPQQISGKQALSRRSP